MPVPIVHIILHSKCVKEGLCQTVDFSIDEIKKQNSYHKFLLVRFNHFEIFPVFFCPQAEFINSWKLFCRNWSRFTFLIQPQKYYDYFTINILFNTINSVYCKQIFHFLFLCIKFKFKFEINSSDFNKVS